MWPIPEAWSVHQTNSFRKPCYVLAIILNGKSTDGPRPSRVSHVLFYIHSVITVPFSFFFSVPLDSTRFSREYPDTHVAFLSTSSLDATSSFISNYSFCVLPKEMFTSKITIFGEGQKVVCT